MSNLLCICGVIVIVLGLLLFGMSLFDSDKTVRDDAIEWVVRGMVIVLWSDYTKYKTEPSCPT